MGRRRDQADVALALAVGLVVAADREQAGQLALRAGVRLDRDPVVAGHLGQPRLELVDQPAVAERVLGRGERVQVGEARAGSPAPSRWSRSASSCTSPSGIMPRSSA